MLVCWYGGMVVSWYGFVIWAESCGVYWGVTRLSADWMGWSSLPYHTIPYHTIPYHTIPYHTIPYYTIPYHTIPYLTIPHHTIQSPYYLGGNSAAHRPYNTKCANGQGYQGTRVPGYQGTLVPRANGQPGNKNGPD